MALISNSAILRPHSRTAETIRCLMKPLEFALLVPLACTSVLLGQTTAESPRFTLAITADKARVTKGADVEIVIEMTICSINRAHTRSVSGNLTRRARRKGLIRLESIRAPSPSPSFLVRKHPRKINLHHTNGLDSLEGRSCFAFRSPFACDSKHRRGRQRPKSMTV